MTLAIKCVHNLLLQLSCVSTLSDIIQKPKHGIDELSRGSFTSDKGGGIFFACVRLSVCLSACLSVCLSMSKIIEKACMDLEEMLRVDRCRDTDELINF